MALRLDGFDTQLEDQDAFIQPTPATEIALGELVVQSDYGVVTDNEFGRIEIGEDQMSDELGGFGLAARDGRSEIGDEDVGGYAPAEGRSEIGKHGLAARDGRSEIGYTLDVGDDVGDDDVGAHLRRQLASQAEIGRRTSGYAPAEGRSEIGQRFDRQVAQQAKIGRRWSGYAPAEGRSEIGADWFPEIDGPPMSTIGKMGLAARDGRSEIGKMGLAARDGRSEIGKMGLAARDGRSEIGYTLDVGEDVGYTLDVGEEDMGYTLDVGEEDLGYTLDVGEEDVGYTLDVGEEDLGYTLDVGRDYGLSVERTEIGAQKMILEVIKTARDNRRPAPPMKAVDVDDPFPDTFWDEALINFVGAVAEATANPDPFPLTRDFMQRAGSGIEPRFVRIDSAASYNKMRQERSPELSELRQLVTALKQEVEAHAADPYAHQEASSPQESVDLIDDIHDLVLLGEEAKQAEMEKKLDFWMPDHYDGYVTAWREEDFVGAALALPSPDGNPRIATSIEPLDKCVGEMAGHAADAGVGNSDAMGCAMGCGPVLGAGTIMKEIAAAAPAIANRPEMKTGRPFTIRIEPKVNPALCALAMLAIACRTGNNQACAEWRAMGEAAPAPVKQAMQEAMILVKAGQF